MHGKFLRFLTMALLVLLAVSVFACLSAEIPPGNFPAEPEELPTLPPLVVEPQVKPEEPIVERFDPKNVSTEVKEATLIDIKVFIDGLNSIIQARDYDRWFANLTEEYRSYYGSPEVLAELSDMFVIKRQGIVLRSLRDYFTHVVYPSRQNDKVDEIEYLDQNLIRAFTVSPRGDRLVLYTLEKINNTWKITRQ